MDITAKLQEARKCINQAIIGLGQKEKDNVFEIRIPNLRPNEVPFVRNEIRIITKDLVNILTARRKES